MKVAPRRLFPPHLEMHSHDSVRDSFPPQQGNIVDSAAALPIIALPAGRNIQFDPAAVAAAAAAAARELELNQLELDVFPGSHVQVPNAR